MSNAWKEHGTKHELDTLDGLLDSTSSWLYGEGDDVPKEQYDAKKSALTAITNKLQSRHKEWNSVPAALEELKKAVDAYRAEATSTDEKYAHIPQDELKKILTQCDDAERVVGEKLEAFKKLQKDQDPIFFSSDLNQRRENLTTSSNRILSTPKPKPPPPAKEEEKPAATGEKMEEEKTEGQTEKKENMETEVD